MSVVNNSFKTKIAGAAKWSVITQIATKIVTPVSSMVLARVLTPEAFGVVATVTMIVSFADMFTDAGFQKYLVQREFNNDDEKYKNTNVAFWTNLGISLFLWAIITIFCEPIATLVGNKGLGNVITVACIQLPLTSFSSIQMALYRRDFDFKTLFKASAVTVFIPFFVTIPLAIFFGLSYWAPIIGAICAQLSNATILTIKSKWKPNYFYSLGILKEMLSFTMWSLIEAISIWFTVWMDTFIIGSVLNGHYLGLYKTSTTMVYSLMGLITASTLPVLFSSLSRLQNDSIQFNQMYFKTQRMVSFFIFPMSIGLYLYSDLATRILLGSQWNEASEVIGLCALTSAITIVFGYFCSEVYRAKGRPKLSFLTQVLYLAVLVPVCIISSKYGFLTFVHARFWVPVQGLLVDFIIMKLAIGIPVFKTIWNVFPTAFAAAVMGVIGFFWRQQYDDTVWPFTSIILCMAVYFGLIYLFPTIRKEMMEIVKKRF
jgi:O-antigen/teichoic acid export membrane protein